MRAGAAWGPRPSPPRPGHVGVRRPRRRGGPATAAPRCPDGAAARAAVRCGHRAGLRLPHRPQSHLQVSARERADPGLGQGGAAAGPPPFPEAVLLQGLGQSRRRGLEGRGRSAAPCTRCGRAALGTGILRAGERILLPGPTTCGPQGNCDRSRVEGTPCLPQRDGRGDKNVAGERTECFRRHLPHRGCRAVAADSRGHPLLRTVSGLAGRCLRANRALLGGAQECDRRHWAGTDAQEIPREREELLPLVTRHWDRLYSEA